MFFIFTQGHTGNSFNHRSHIKKLAKKMECHKSNNLCTKFEKYENLRFEMLGLKKELELGIKTCGFELPSKVQQACIPKACAGLDILCQARNGIGKTLVYIIATLQQLPQENNNVNALVICPTRELALQVRQQFKQLSEFLPDITTECFFGGLPVSRDEQILLERPPHIIIGTPGRILQLVKRKTLNLGNLRHFIVDECDEIFQSLSMRKTVQDIFVSTHDINSILFRACS